MYCVEDIDPMIPWSVGEGGRGWKKMEKNRRKRELVGEDWRGLKEVGNGEKKWERVGGGG